MIGLLLVIASLLLIALGLYRSAYLTHYRSVGPSDGSRTGKFVMEEDRKPELSRGAMHEGSAPVLDISGDGALAPTPEHLEMAARPEDDYLVAKASAVVDRRLGGASFGVAELAEELGMSSRQLQRRMRDSLGLTPVAYIRELRMVRAKALLEEGTRSVAEVSHVVGIASPSYFARCFRERFGRNPSDFGRRPASSVEA